MKPIDPDLESLLRRWIEKADADLEAAEDLTPRVSGSPHLREIVGFHCQQTVEKYLKALLTFYQIEFPKTHEIDRLLALAGRANPAAAASLAEAEWLGPFGADIRYPGNAAQMLPGDEARALELARMTKAAVLRILDLG